MFLLDAAGESELAPAIDLLATPGAHQGAGHYLALADLPPDAEGETVQVRVLAFPAGAAGSCDASAAVPVVPSGPCLCQTGAECLAEGEFSTACFDDGARARCVGGSLVPVACGQDSCDDSGTGYGGGSCVAIDAFCAAGACGQTVTSGTDTCLGDASVRAYACADGARCVAADVTESDSCVDTGTASGGGSCAATNWTCAGGLLQATTSGGDDTCAGTADAPELRTFHCTAADGTDADTCTPSVRTEADLCVDSGSASGGGVCQAIDWRCEAGTLLSTSTGGADACEGTADDPQLVWYACAASDGTAADTCATEQRGESDTCADTGDELGGGSCQATDWRCEGGVLSSATSGGSDTCGGDVDDATVTYFSCAAQSGSRADTCQPAETLRSDTCLDSGDGLGGGTCSAVDWRCEGGALTSTSSGGTDTCGGDGDHPSVTWHRCEAANGSAPDTCAALVAARSDLCEEVGTELGGGACSATDWTCADGRLSSVATSGQDVCGGDDDAPSVTRYRCAAGEGTLVDRCEASETVRMDSCADDGGELGGGSCHATDWSCEGGLLSAATSGGDDACGGDQDAPSVTFWSCSVQSGVIADACAVGATVRQDACADDGHALGGGTCAASDWSCVAGDGPGELVVTDTTASTRAGARRTARASRSSAASRQTVVAGATPARPPTSSARTRARAAAVRWGRGVRRGRLGLRQRRPRGRWRAGDDRQPGRRRVRGRRGGRPGRAGGHGVPVPRHGRRRRRWLPARAGQHGGLLRGHGRAVGRGHLPGHELDLRRRAARLRRDVGSRHLRRRLGPGDDDLPVRGRRRQRRRHLPGGGRHRPAHHPRQRPHGFSVPRRGRGRGRERPVRQRPEGELQPQPRPNH
ncbi:MAG: hypothetical protein R3F39_14890 [Myxococcota bacterium]